MARMMKDSGIPWIGKIPSDWSIGRMKYNYYMKGRIGWQGLKAEEFIDDGPFLITGTDFINGRVNWDTCYHISQERYDEAPEIHVKDGDLLITKDGTVGKVAFIENKPDQVSLNSHLLLIRPKRWAYENRFLFWVLQSGVFTKFNLMSQNGTVMASLSQEKISAFSFPLPDVEEQLRIASFLNKECARIDEVIEKTRASIEEYKKLKQSVITQAVTKGIRPDREMKDSGVEWIGEIADDYKIVKLKHVLRKQLQYGASQTGIPYDKTLPRYIRITDITLEGKLKEEGALSLPEEYAAGFILSNNDVLFARSGATVGKAFIYKEEYGRSAFAGYLIKATLNESLLPDLLFYYTQSSIYEEWKNQIFVQATIQNIGADRYRELPIILQPMAEQRKLVRFLSDKCGEIDLLISKKEELIKQLGDYKKGIIFEYVTGKKEVPA